MNKKLFTNVKRMTTVFTVAILLITVLVLMLRLTVFRDTAPDLVKDDAPQVMASTPKETKNNKEEAPKDLVFDYKIASSITFKNFESAANPQIKNSANNTALMHIKIIRDDNKRAVYESGYLRPGVNQSTIRLQGTPLEAGTYQCTVEIIALDQESLKALDTFTQPIEIIINENLEDMEGEAELPDEGEVTGEEGGQ